MGGTIYNALMEKAGDFPAVRDYMSGKTDNAAYRREIAAHKGELEALGLPEGWIGLLARLPRDRRRAAREMLEELYEACAVGSPVMDESGYMEFAELVGQRFEHPADRYTSIFPEETRSAFALSYALRPASVFVAGSYYGYLAVWLLPGLAEDGYMVCSDVDADVCRLAGRNMAAMGGGGRVDVICEDAEALLLNKSGPIDLLVLDAYGSHGHPDPRYHGKAIYGRLLTAALPRLHSRSLLLVHNAEPGSPELGEFLGIVKGARLSLYLNTTENMAVYQL